ncbi:MAG: ABC transporter permease [Spirochaetaceae bacterium]|nr:MAG: ABC transporter permease [Spirochaetaceae bacterium]
MRLPFDRLRGSHHLLSLATVVLLLAGWTLIAHLEVVPELFIPRPSSVWSAFREVTSAGYRGGTLSQHLAGSMTRVAVGYLLAVATAIPLGLLMGHSRRVQALLDPVIEFYRPLPPLAYYTLLIVWLGIGDESKIALLYLAAFPPLSINAMSAVKAVNCERVESALSLGASRSQVFRRVIFPSCLPQIFTGLRVSIGFTYTTLVSSEIVAAANGIGWMVLDAGRFLRTDIIFVAIIVMGLTGLALDGLIRLAETRFVPWKGRE